METISTYRHSDIAICKINPNPALIDSLFSKLEPISGKACNDIRSFVRTVGHSSE